MPAERLPEGTGGVFAAPRGIALPSEGAPGRGAVSVPAVALRAVYVIGALLLFVFALEVLKAGATGVGPILTTLSADGFANLLGFGWLGAYVALSGSPVAIAGITLFSQDVITDTEAFAILNGARFGASFIVLAIGFLYYLYYYRKSRSASGIFIGVVALLTTLTIWSAAIPIGVLALHEGWLDSVQTSLPGAFSSSLDAVYGPLIDGVRDRVPSLLIFGLGFALLLASFALFDRALPDFQGHSLGVERIKDRLHHPLAMFLLGLITTALTLSVAISLTLLVPLAHKGYVRREEVIPYVMGANIATWVDTLIASLLLDSPHALTIVVTQMAVGAAVSLAVLLIAYGPYSRGVIAVARRVTRSRPEFALFLGAIFLVPLALLVV